ncbi:MAG TPA: multiheme c-type cytochrome [Ignavibacteria bacterium]|nr:multiheme c-type cytochrome [Ignavibacteria bacterium]
MKYTSYILFGLFILASILFLKSALKPEVLPLQITGSEKCSSCHSLKNLGNQQKVWENSKHSGAYYSLLSDKARSFSHTKGMESPEQNKICLKCHTTKGILEIETVDASYNIKEGVGCEGCHGAGSWYSPAEIMKDEALFLKNNGIKGNEETCLKCHSKIAADKNGKLNESVCPFQENDFDYKPSLEKIKHPLSK